MESPELNDLNGANTISLRNTAHLAIRRLHLDGRQLNVAGVVAEADSAWNHDILLEHLRIRHHDGAQGNSDVSILQNTIVARGFGIRIDAPDPAFRQVIAGNAVFAGPGSR